LDVREADYEFSGPFTYLKHQLSDFAKVAFFDAQEAQNKFAWLFGTLQTSLQRLNQSSEGRL
jgi:hypothetical protein